MRAAFVWALACAAALPPASHAELTSIVKIESKPSGAQVYLLRGSQRVPIGRTPLDYAAEFHSAQSVLRIAFERPGYKPARLELSASESRLIAELVGKPLVADPASHSDAELRRLQDAVNPALKGALSAILELKTDWSVDVADAAKLRRVDAKTLVVVPLLIASERPLAQSSDAAAIAKEIWEKLAQPAVIKIARAVGRPHGVDGLVVEPRFDLQRHGFRVGHSITSRTEMRCVPGGKNMMVSTYHACASRDSRGFCVSGLKNNLTYVHDPCASMQPFTVTDTAFNTSTTATRDLARVTYLVLTGAGGEGLDFSEVDAALRDAQQKVLWQQGKLPPSL